MPADASGDRVAQPDDERQWDRMNQQERRRLLDWIVESVCVFGARLDTAYLVAAEFTHGMETEPRGWWPK